MSRTTRSAGRSAVPSAEGLKGPHFKVVTADPTTYDRAAGSGIEAVHLATHGLRKSYRKGVMSVPVLRGVDLEIREGEFVSIVGKSGSGKSTLLHVLATLDAPDTGQITFRNRRIDNLSAGKRDQFRNRNIGIVFQFYHLLPELTTLENVLLPSMIGGSIMSFLRQRTARRARAAELLRMVGLEHRMKHRPRELSGGEMQRVAIARALMSSPEILLADEPTGNLDGQTGVQIMELLRSLNRDQKLTIVMVTHDAAIASQSHRVIQLVEGKVDRVD